MEQYRAKDREPLQKYAVHHKTIKKIRRFLPAIVFMALIYAFSSMPASEVARTTKPIIRSVPQVIQVNHETTPVKINWLKVGHFIGYSGLGLAYLYAFRPSTRKPMIAAVLASFLYSITDEFHQTFVPGRHAWLVDIALDTFASTLSILVAEVSPLIFKRVSSKK